MTIQSPIVLASGFFSQLFPGDTVPGTDTTAQASGNAALVLANTALASGNAGISVGLTAQASGNAGISIGLTALASGNAGISTGLTALASGNAGISTGLTALASGNAALSLADLKLPLSGGVLTGDVILDNQVDARFREATASGVNYVGFQAPANIVSDILFTLPSADGTSGQAVVTNGSGDLSFASLTGTRNRIINGDFSVAQRGASFVSGANNNDAYTLDRWYILSDGNDAIDVTQETSTVPTNQKYAIALDVETTNKKFGIAQIIENVNCVGLTGGNVTLSFKAKVSSTTKLDNVKAAIVAWSGTADTVTSDIISAWGAEGTNPTLIANATYENTPANLSVTTSYATYSLSANIDTASTSNIIVFIWSDVTDTTAGDFLYITDVQLEPGSVATPFERRSYGQELALCQRYFQLAGNGCFGAVDGSSSSTIAFTEKFFVPMRAAPTVTWQTGATAEWRYSGSDISNGGSTSLANTISTINAVWSQQGGFAGLSSNLPVWSRNQTSTGEFMACNAEL